MVPPSEMSLSWVAADFEPELKLSFMCNLFSAETVKMNGPQRTAMSRKELWQKQKQKGFLIILYLFVWARGEDHWADKWTAKFLNFLGKQQMMTWTATQAAE